MYRHIRRAWRPRGQAGKHLSTAYHDLILRWRKLESPLTFVLPTNRNGGNTVSSHWKTTMSKLLILALASASLSSGSLLRRWADKCESFTLPEIPEGINVTLTDVSYYPAGSLVEHTNDPNTNFTASDLKDFCRVQLNITTSESSLTKSEVWLPDDWNGRFWGTGNGASGGGSTFFLDYQVREPYQD